MCQNIAGLSPLRRSRKGGSGLSRTTESPALLPEMDVREQGWIRYIKEKQTNKDLVFGIYHRR